MVLYLKAESDIPDLMIDFIEVKLKSGQIISLTWDESEFDREDGQFEARYKGVYFDDEYGNGRLSELKGMKIQHIELYSECEDVSSFKLRELSFHDGEESLAFSYPECRTERSSDGEATETTNSTIERRFCSMRANRKEVTQSMRKLIAELTKADIAYYKHDNPLMTDREYDRKLDQLRSLEEESGIILSGSQTQKVSGEILEELVSVRHTKPMLSAGKTKSIDELVKFAGGRDVVLSWKMDGLTLVLRYENGVLQQAITRGREGIIGEDVTHTVRKFDNVPLAIPVKDAIEVRGEGVISWENFEKINLSLEEPYGHPRNLASGSTRKLNAAEAGKRHLEFAAFELVTDMQMDTKAEQLAFMEQLGFLVVPYVQIPLADDAAIRQAVAKMKPEEFAYPVDGLILEQDDIAYGRSLGSTGHHENRMMALKCSGAELCGSYEKDSIALIEQNLDEAIHNYKTKFTLSVFIIDDFHLSVASVNEGVSKTVNSQILTGWLMNLADRAKAERKSRIPFIFLGNDFSNLYSPLTRDGRMDFYEWKPSDKEKENMICAHFEDCIRGDRNWVSFHKLIAKYHLQPISFFVELKNDLLKSQVKERVKANRNVNAIQLLGELNCISEETLMNDSFDIMSWLDKLAAERKKAMETKNIMHENRRVL